MDPNLCFLCSKKSTNLNITYSCGHSFCEGCFPYIMFDLIQNQGLDKNFYNSSYSKHPCPICHVGVTSFPFPKLIEAFDLIFQEGKKKKNPKCSRCEENESESFCHDCNNKFCSSCLNLIHSGRGFGSHRIVNVEENDKGQIDYTCTCPAKQFLTSFCSNCQTAACEYCASIYHKNHQILALEKLTFDEKRKEVAQKKLRILGGEVKEFQEKVRRDFKKHVQEYTDDFSHRLDEFIIWLQEFKLENQRRIENELEILDSKINLINAAVMKIEEETKNVNIHPQKKIQIHRILNNLIFKKNSFSTQKKTLFKNNLHFPEFEETKQRITSYSFEEINTIVSDFQKQLEVKVTDAKLFNEDDMNMEAILFDNFSISPDEILSEAGKMIENNSFDCYLFGKSNLSGSFILSDETFLFWSGYCKDENEPYNVTYPLIIYNISEMQREINLMETNKYKVTTVGVYPKNEMNYSHKKLLYCADISGMLRIFEINNDCEKSFLLKSRIKTGVKEGIMTAAIFCDKFNEMGKEEGRLYLWVSFLKSDEPLRLYRNVESEEDEIKWEIFREINNPTNQICSVITFYHDELLFKTKIFIGFTNLIKIYDLELNQWDKIQFFANKGLASIDFILKTEESDSKFKEPLIIRKIVYSQWGHGLSIADINTGEVILQKILKKCSGIMDFCIWNLTEEVLILATTNHNSLKVLSIKNNLISTPLELNTTPINLVKILQKIKKGNEYFFKEKLAVISGQGEESSIIIYE